MPPASVAILSAILFGASTPLAKLLTNKMCPELLAGILYLGSGIGLSVLTLRHAEKLPGQFQQLKTKDGLWLSSAILFGGVFGPLLLMTGLSRTPAAEASLLLNLEPVLTAIIAWIAFKENFDLRILIGMVAIVAGGLILCASPAQMHTTLGALAIVGACACWALDNNFTRNVETLDAMFIAASKGLIAGLINIGLGIAKCNALPGITPIAASVVVGFICYGLSLVMFIHSLRLLGTARTGAYFSTAPFVGAILSVILLCEPLSITLLMGGLVMGIGVWLHLTEHHEHEHTHELKEHEHMHFHDDHHQHEHDVPIASSVQHSHWHKHETLTHAHPHYPDIHHRHEH